MTATIIAALAERVNKNETVVFSLHGDSEPDLEAIMFAPARTFSKSRETSEDE